MKVLITSRSNNSEKIIKALTDNKAKCVYGYKEVTDVETGIGIKSGIEVEVDDATKLIMDIGSEFTEDEKLYDIGITSISEEVK